jgi:glycosyl transferase family 25
MENIDKIIYINLDKRTDRRKEIEAEFKRLNITENKIIRFPAIEHEYSAAGCNLSHAAALKLAKSLSLKNALILEDDFNFIDNIEILYQKVDYFFKKNIEWDVLLFAHCVSQSLPVDNESELRISIKCQNAGGYLVNSHMFEALSQTIYEAADPLAKTHQHWVYQNDIVWNKYMHTHRWYYFNYLGYQRESYSDLSKRVIFHYKEYTP